MHIGLVVCHKECNFYMQDEILAFVKSIEADFKKMRDRHTLNKDPDGVRSYALFIANYGGVVAFPTNPLYCLVYPTAYNEDVEDQNHFNTAASLSGMCTCACMCDTHTSLGTTSVVKHTKSPPKEEARLLTKLL